jgi:hypothetical protein
MRRSSDEIEKRIKEIISAPEQKFPSFTGEEKRAYDSIAEQLRKVGPNDPRDELYPPLQPSLLEVAKRPPDIAEKPWNAVMDQLRVELSYKQATHQFFQAFNSFIMYVFVKNLSYLTNAGQLAQATMEEEGTFVLKSIVNVSQAAMGELGVPGVGVAIALMNVVIEKGMESGEVDKEAVAGTLTKLHSALERNFAGYRKEIQKLERQILYRWGSLRLMGKSLSSGEIKWPPDDKISEAAITAYKVSLWKILLPAVWHIMKPQKDPRSFPNINWFDGYIKVNPNYYLWAKRVSDRTYEVYMRWLGRGVTVFNHQQPSKTMCAEIFDTLKVSRVDLFEEKNGWKGFTRQMLLDCAGSRLAIAMKDEDQLLGADFMAQLDALRRLREDLNKSAMGRWYVSVYDKIAGPIMDLYSGDPARDIARAIERYNGRDAYNALINMIQTGGRAHISPEQADNIVAIITVVIDTSVRMLGDKNPVQLSAEAVMPRLFPYIGRSYSEVMEILQKEEPPKLPVSSKKRAVRTKTTTRRKGGKRTGGKA